MSEYVDVLVTVLRLSGRAALLEVDGDQQWVPLSLLNESLDETDVGTSLTVTIAAFKAEELGWS